MRTIIGLAALLAIAAPGLARAGDYPFLDELTRYAERIDPLSVTSGDAQNANAALQIIDPWPPYARDRRIPADGRRMVGAIRNFQKGGQEQAPAAQTGSTGMGGGLGIGQ